YAIVQSVSCEIAELLSRDKTFAIHSVPDSDDPSVLCAEVNRWRCPGDFAIQLRLGFGISSLNGVHVYAAETAFRQRQAAMIRGAIAANAKLIARDGAVSDSSQDSIRRWISGIDGLVGSFV